MRVVLIFFNFLALQYSGASPYRLAGAIYLYCLKLYYNIKDFTSNSRTVLTTGTFDGVHLGHRTIIDRVNHIAQHVNGESVLLTFNPHPRQVLQPDGVSLKLLSTVEEKAELLEKAGIQHLVIHPFTKEFAATSSTDFIQEILVRQMKVSKLVIGYNHRFGSNREGSFEHLNQFGPQYGFEVEEISAKDVDEVEVSSTRIRQALGEGDVSKAALYLGYYYFLSGTVIRGDQRGRTIGFPTANLQVSNTLKLVPADGVYAVKVQVGDVFFPGMLNIGTRPTFETIPSIEAHLFSFDKDIYGASVRIYFISKLREERKFSGIDALKHQLNLDKELALSKLSAFQGNLLA